MKKYAVFLLISLFPGIVLAQNAACEFAPKAKFEGDSIVATKWSPIKAPSGTGIAFKSGEVRGISEDGVTYLGVKIERSRFHPLPAHLQQRRHYNGQWMTEDEFNAALRPIKQNLEKTPLILPAGSTLRITLEDRTTLVLRTVEEYRFMGEAELVEATEKSPARIRHEYRVIPRYLVDADSAALLDNNLVATLRMELPDEYFYFGHRSQIWNDRVISKKTMGTIQGVLKCVSQA